MRIRPWLILLIVLLGPASTAWAWGPAIHIELAVSLLDQLGILPTAIAALLSRHVMAYVYGNIAADVVFAKRLSRVKQFCHHWSTGFRLLERATDDEHKAFAYGYLSHLAADTVAHGKFVPRQIAISRCTHGFGHFYWELRADSTVSEPNWNRLREVLKWDQTRHHDVLAGHIVDTFLPYELNRMVFETTNALAVRERFRHAIDFWGQWSRWPLPIDLVDAYRAESLERIQSVLALGTSSPVLRDDPTGTSAFMSIRICRRDVRRLRRRGLPTERRLLEICRTLAPAHLLDAINLPNGLLAGPSESDVP